MLNVYTLAQAQDWDSVVRSFAEFDVYDLSGYVKAFALHGDGEPLLFYYKTDTVRGINVVMKRDIANDARFAGKLPAETWFDFATPYGYGGWLIEGDGDSAPLFAAYEDWCREHHVISEFVRYHAVLGNQRYSESAYDVLALGGTIAMDTSSPEVIWANLTSKNRNVIRKAEKNGVVIGQGSTPELYETFRTIYNGTMDKDHAAAYYYFGPEFYDSVRLDLPDEAQIFYACLPDGTIIAASIMLTVNGRMNYHLSGSLREYQHLAPTNLLLYRAALWACEQGCKTLHLGGGVGSGEDSLFKFKRAFYRGEPCRFHIGRKIFLPGEYDRLVAMRQDLPESGYFPRYRA